MVVVGLHHTLVLLLRHRGMGRILVRVSPWDLLRRVWLRIYALSVPLVRVRVRLHRGLLLLLLLLLSLLLLLLLLLLQGPATYVGGTGYRVGRSGVLLMWKRQE